MAATFLFIESLYEKVFYQYRYVKEQFTAILSTQTEYYTHPEQILRFEKDASKDDFTNLTCALLTMTVLIVLRDMRYHTFFTA